MLKMVTFAPAFGVPTPTPFGLKLETYLRMAEIPFEVAHDSDPRKAPKGKIPFIIDGDRTLGDSQLIIQYLIEKHGDKLDQALTEEQRGIGHAVRRMLEEGAYFVVVYARWIDDAGWPIVRERFFGKLPFPLRSIVPGMVRSSIKKTLHGQGLGRHTPDEIYAMGKADIDAMAAILGGKPFVLGDAPTSVDATAYGFLAQLLHTTLGGPLTDHAKKKSNLVAYVDRMRDRYFPAKS